MRIKFMQDIIDMIRKPTYTDSFEKRIKMLIKHSCPYYYPEDKMSDVVDNVNKVQICLNPLANFRQYYKALKRLDNLSGGGGIKKMEYTYNELDDEYSREMFLIVVVRTLFDDVKIRFPQYYFRNLDRLPIFEQMKINDEEIKLWYNIIKLHNFDLSLIGYDTKIMLNVGGVQIDFIDEQYAYKNIIQVEKGDNVLDCGACYGDTALYFINKNKNCGKVYSFEFLPENIKIFKKNMDLNPKYKDNITLIQQPVSDTSGQKLYFVPNGPGTSITMHKTKEALEVETISIDDFIKQNGIKKIDFIKMDIEGSEKFALKGASETIKTFKPKLAICVYHLKDDLITIPKIIKDLVPEYKLYLDHYCINNNETVLYAKV